jgi:hypothetical protein
MTLTAEVDTTHCAFIAALARTGLRTIINRGRIFTVLPMAPEAMESKNYKEYTVTAYPVRSVKPNEEMYLWFLVLLPVPSRSEMSTTVTL